MTNCRPAVDSRCRQVERVLPNILEQALELTEAILEATRTEDWKQVECLESRRQPLIRQAFDQPDTLSTKQALRLKRLNDLIVEELAARRQQARDAQLTLRQGRQAVRTYLGLDP